MPSLLAIVSHTPAAVWAVLAVLVLLGLRQTRTQRMSAARVWIVPAVVGAASLASARLKFATTADPENRLPIARSTVCASLAKRASAPVASASSGSTPRLAAGSGGNVASAAIVTFPSNRT